MMHAFAGVFSLAKTSIKPTYQYLGGIMAILLHVERIGALFRLLCCNIPTVGAIHRWLHPSDSSDGAKADHPTEETLERDIPFEN